jgi:hypothetical protein
MGDSKMKKYKSGFTEEQRKIIRKDLAQFTERHASLLGFPPEAVVQEIRYWQQSNPDWRTTPTPKHKESSFKHYDGICQLPECRRKRRKISSIADAVFHHKERGIPNSMDRQTCSLS